MKINDAIICPKCQRQFMNKSVTGHPKIGMEYFCHNCHVYFGIFELVTQWGYDSADLHYSPNVNKFSIHENMIEEWDADTVSDMYEPEWVTVWEHKEAYRMVGRMHLGVSELDDLIDLRNTEACALNMGVQ